MVYFKSYWCGVVVTRGSPKPEMRVRFSPPLLFVGPSRVERESVGFDTYYSTIEL